MQALETALRPEVKKFKEGLDIAHNWIDGDHPPSSSPETDLAIRFLGGEAAMEYLKGLPAASADQSELRKRQIDWARQQFTVVAAAAGPYQARAKIRLLDPIFGGDKTSKPGTFADALNHAAAAMERLRLARQGAARADAGDDADFDRQRRQQIVAAQSEALKCCKLAMDLRSVSQPSAEEYDTVRYYLAYLHYAADELDEAAALGESVAQNSSNSGPARLAATVGLAARETLLRRAGEASRSTAAERLRTLAEKIVQRWGDRAEADDARASLLDLALDGGRLDRAEQLLDEISSTSPRRGEIELKVGQALWRQAKGLLQASTWEHNYAAEAEKKIARATSLLTDGIGRCKATDGGNAVDKYRASLTGAAAGSVPRTLAAGMLALAEIDMTEGRPAESIALLEDPVSSATLAPLHWIPLRWQFWPISPPAIWTRPGPLCGFSRPRCQPPPTPMPGG